MDFKDYLLQNNYAQSTITEHENNIRRIKEWCKEAHLIIKKLNYIELLSYADHQKKQGLHVHTINLRLNSLTHYFNYLIGEGQRTNNPAQRLRIKGATIRILKDVLTRQELEDLYTSYSQQVASRGPYYKKIHERNTLMLSLMIYQGINSGTIQKLQPWQINLKTATIAVPATTTKSNPRTLSLEPCQILPLYHYLNELNPAAQKMFTIKISPRVKDLIKALKKINPKVQSAQQIRASVLIYWIKLYNKRQAQYMIGHKHISSTERYEQQDLETLINQVNKYHPFS